MSQQKADVDGLQNGPIMERSCTDIFCCIIFSASVIAMFIAAFIAYANNNSQLIGAIIDPDGNPCGSGDLQNYSYGFFQIPFNNIDLDQLTVSQIFKHRVCVSQCPADNKTTTLKCSTNSVVTSCKGINSQKQPQQGDTDLHIYPSVQAGTICLPTSSTVDQIISSSFGKGQGGSYIDDTIQTLISKKWYFLLAAIIAVALTMIYLMFLRCCVGVMVWISIFSVLALLIGGGVFCYLNKWIALAIILWIAAALYLIVFVICSYQKLKIAIAIYKAASRMVTQNIRLILIPIFTTLIIVLFLMWWTLSGALWISRSLVAQKGDLLASISDYKNSQMVYTYYYFFCGLWVVAWISATGQFIIISFSCIWYYHQKDDLDAHSPLTTSFNWAYCKHIGSLAFGSFFIAVIELLRIILQYIISQTKQGGQAAEAAASCARCCLACLQKIIQCINRTAYTFIALSGQKYCICARKGISLAMSNPFHLVILSGVGEAIQVLGNLIISLLTSLIFYYMAGLNNGQTSRGVISVLIVFLMAYIISGIFMGVQTTSADAMIICFFIDNQIQNKTGGKQAQRAPQEFKVLYEDM